MSSWINHPTGFINLNSILKRNNGKDKSDLLPKIDAKYKFTSIDLILSSDIIVHERETYSILEWLGDIGGLFDAL